MINKEVTVKCATGLHARPATLLVRKAGEFKADIALEFNGKKANAKSLIGVLSLGVTRNAAINVSAAGDDEALAVEQVVRLIAGLE